MTPETEDLIQDLLVKELQRLRQEAEAERAARKHVSDCHLAAIKEAQSLRTKLALLEAECARLKRQKLQAEAYPESSFLVIP